MNTSDCLQERHFAAIGPAAYAKGHANQADKYGVGQKGDKRCLCSAGKAANAAPAYGLSRWGLVPGIRSPATHSLCSAGASRLPRGKEHLAHPRARGGGREHLQGWSRLRCPFSLPSPAPQMPPLLEHFGFCCRRFALPRNPTSSFSRTTKCLSKTSRGCRKKSGKHRLDAARGCRSWLRIEMPPRPPARTARVERPTAAISKGLLHLTGPRGAIVQAATELLGGNALLAELSNARFPSLFFPVIS